MVTAEDIARAAELIQGGRLVAFPTETVYGLGANALDANAVRRIYQAKGRPASSPLIVHVADITLAKSLAADWPPLADLLARLFWPGPLTIIVKKARVIPDEVTAGLDSVGLRIPAHAVAQQLLTASMRPIAAPSANRFTELSPTTADHVRSSLGNKVDMILDGGACTVGIESTVVSLAGERPVILRPGMINAVDLKTATGFAWPVAAEQAHPSASPGLHPKHYAPRTPLYVLRPDDHLPPGNGKVLEMPMHPEDYAEVLYTRLHEADTHGLEWVAVPEPPNAPQWQGIRDRLRRAASGKWQ
jgi:L-threonylcarbamoyladenylate synthase